MGIGGENPSVNAGNSWAGIKRNGGKHRTEVTEVTEGGWGSEVKTLR